MDYERRKQVAEWLNTLGYQFELDSDGLWLEDYDFTEHKTKDVIDIILAWSDKNFKPNELKGVSNNELTQEVCDACGCTKYLIVHKCYKCGNTLNIVGKLGGNDR